MKYYNPKVTKKLDKVCNIRLIKENSKEYVEHYASAYPDPSILIKEAKNSGPYYFRNFDDLYQGYVDKKEWYIPIKGKRVILDNDWLYASDWKALRSFYEEHYGLLGKRQPIYVSSVGVYMLYTKEYK